MANEIRHRQLAIGGLVEDNPLTAAATTLTSAGLAALDAVASTHYVALTLDPDGVDGAPEVVWITAHVAAATTATVIRGREGTTAREHARDIPWVHAPTVKDYSEKKTVTAQALGSHAGGAAAFTWHEITDMGNRGLVSKFIVTPSTLTDTVFDVEVRSASAGGGELLLQALDVTGEAYEITAPWYFESTENNSMWVGIKNESATDRSFTLDVRMERFA